MDGTFGAAGVDEANEPIGGKLTLAFSVESEDSGFGAPAGELLCNGASVGPLEDCL